MRSKIFIDKMVAWLWW